MSRNRRASFILAALAAHAIGCVNLPPAAGGEPTTRSIEQRPAREPAVELVAFLDAHKLCLSTDDHTSADRFPFVLHLAGTLPDGNLENMSICVDRDRDNAAIIIQTADGIPYCYMTEGLLVIFDRDHPGTAVVREGGHPEFSLTGDADKARLIFNLSYYKTVGHCQITLNIGSVVAASLKKVKSVIETPDREGFEMETATSSMSIETTPVSQAFFAIQRLSIHRPPHLALILSDFVGEPMIPKEALMLTKASIDASGMITRSVGNDGDIPLDSLVIPPRFAQEFEERAAAMKLADILKERHPATTKPGVDSPGVKALGN